MSIKNREDLVYATCLLLVKHYRNLVAYKKNTGEKLGYHSRIFKHMLHPEENFCYVGKSEKAVLENNPKNEHPEHVVPCAYMMYELESLIEEGKHSDEELARALQKNWKVANISKEEATKLNSELKLKSTMPEGWDFMTGNPEDRLTQAGIKLIKS